MFCKTTVFQAWVLCLWRKSCFANSVFCKTTVFPSLGLLFLGFMLLAKTLVLRIPCLTKPWFFQVWACCFWGLCFWRRPLFCEFCVLQEHDFSKSGLAVFGFRVYGKNTCFGNSVFSETTVLLNRVLLFPSLGLLSFEISAKILVLQNHGFSKSGFAVFWVSCLWGNPCFASFVF